jgi:hypothetical protein
MSRKEFEEVLRELSRRVPRRSSEEGHSEYEARSVLDAQSCCGMTVFTVKKIASSAFLPAGVPLLDHLYWRLEFAPEWSCLKDPVDLLRNHRLPDRHGQYSVMEFTLGRSDDIRVHAALEYLKSKKLETERRFIICQLAADTESISIVKSGVRDILREKPGETRRVRVAAKGERGEPLPVLFMVGHVGWHIHVKIPTVDEWDERGRRHLRIEPGKLQEKVFAFFREIGMVTGIKVREDLEEFFEVVKALYGSDLWDYVVGPLELDVIARLAGYNLLHYSVWTLNWIIFGTILPKGMASVGDGKWNYCWVDLPSALKAYLIGDISQVAAAAWVLLIMWILHIFPDGHAVSQVSTLTQRQLVSWWQTHVMETLVDSSAPIRPWQMRETRQEMMRCVMGTGEDGHTITELTPDWPSLSAGSARYNHTVRAFLIDRLPVLRSLDKAAWPILHPEQYHLVRFGRFRVEPQPSPVGPVNGTGWHPNPDIGPTLLGMLSSEIGPDAIKKVIGQGLSSAAAVLEYTRFTPVSGRELLSRAERSHTGGKAVFGFFRKAAKIVPVMRRMLEVFGMRPVHPQGWEDPYKVEETKHQRVESITSAARGLSRKLREKAESCQERYKALKMAVKDAKRKEPERVDHTWPLLNLITSKNRDRTLPLQEILTIGEKTEARPAKKPRLEEANRSRSPPPQPSGNGSESEHDEMQTVSRRVYYVSRESSESEPEDRRSLPFEVSGAQASWMDRQVVEVEQTVQFDWHSITLEHQEERDAEAGPWVGGPMQYEGRPVSPTDWDRVRQTAFANGYRPSTSNRRFLPG